MTSPDLDALARRIAQRIVLRAHGGTHVPDAAIEIAFEALTDVRAEGFAEGALAMHGKVSDRFREIVGASDDPWARDVASAALADLPLPTIGEKKS